MGMVEVSDNFKLHNMKIEVVNVKGYGFLQGQCSDMKNRINFEG